MLPPPPPEVTFTVAFASWVTPQETAVTVKVEAPVGASAAGLSVAVDAANPHDQEVLVGLIEPRIWAGVDTDKEIFPEQPLWDVSDTA